MSGKKIKADIRRSNKMGIFKRIKDITVAEIHALLDQVEDPFSMLNHYVREMEEEIAKGQQALSNQIFLEKRQMALILNTEEVIAKRIRQAKLAVDRGEEPIAKLALQEKLIHENKLNLYKKQYEMIKNQTTILYEKLNQLKEKYDELKHKRLFLMSRANVARSVKQMNNTFASLNTDNIAKGFTRAEEHVLMMEAETEVSTLLSQPRRDLNSYSIDPSLQEEVQNELEKLKKANQETA
jgi:phage shock protein A